MVNDQIWVFKRTLKITVWRKEGRGQEDAGRQVRSLLQRSLGERLWQLALSRDRNAKRDVGPSNILKSEMAETE